MTYRMSGLPIRRRCQACHSIRPGLGGLTNSPDVITDELPRHAPLSVQQAREENYKCGVPDARYHKT